MELKEKTYIEAIREAFKEELESNEHFIMLGQDIGEMGGVWGQTKGLQAKFGKDRVIDSPISESTMVGMGIGASLIGLKMLVDIQRIDFVPVAMSPIINELSKITFMSHQQTKASCVLYSITGAMPNAGPQHSQALESLFTSIPNLRVLIPSSAFEAKGLLKSAFKADEPILFFSPVQLHLTKSQIPDEPYTLPIDQAREVSYGNKFTLVTYGNPVHICEHCIQSEGYEIELIDLRCVAPLSMDTLVRSLEKTRNLLIIQESYHFGGVCEQIISHISEHYPDLLKHPPKVLCAEFSPIPYCLEGANRVLVTQEKIVQFLKKACTQK